MRGPACPYLHDPDKLAICPNFLSSTCPNSPENCSLSHNPTAHNTPQCSYFQKGSCTLGDECHYSHVSVGKSAPVCADFADIGYCNDGALCKNRHVKECPRYSSTGLCNKKHCKLPHIDTVQTVRKRQASNVEDGNERLSEPESDSNVDDDDEVVEADDIDSDDLIQIGADKEGFDGQDFLHF